MFSSLVRVMLCIILITFETDEEKIRKGKIRVTGNRWMKIRIIRPVTGKKERIA